MKTVYYNFATMIVMMVFTRIPGVSYTVPAGQLSVDVPKTTYVDRGFTVSQSADGVFSFAPPAPEENPPEDPSVPIAERIALLRAEKAEMDAAFNAKLEALEQAVV